MSLRPAGLQALKGEKGVGTRRGDKGWRRPREALPVIDADTRIKGGICLEYVEVVRALWSVKSLGACINSARRGL
jgi:hypothetical protein